MRAIGRARSRKGITKIEVAVFVILLVTLTAVLLPQLGCGGVRETARGNTCRNNMRACANALFQYDNDNGKFPGYMNVIQRTDGSPYVDPDTGVVTPVSWCVMIMPYVDLRPPGKKHVDLALQPKKNPNERIYVEQFLCPSDPQATKTGAPISFVVNTGLPDRPTAVADTPRDWAANGMFFDNFSEHPLVNTDATTRGPMQIMTTSRVKDPDTMTIMLTENADAGEYVFDARTHAADNWKKCEVTTGCIWRPGSIDASTQPPTMTPPTESLKINVGKAHGDGMNYDYCRPSSFHPQSVNVAYVGQNVAQLRDTISYYVFAKLMASDDEHVFEADHPFRTYEITEADIGP